MQSLPAEFVVLCRQLGEVQNRCSTIMAEQAAQIEALQAQVVRLRAEVIARDTRLGLLNEALDASLAAADWVICQTGCLSHDAYWRVQDHCRRTGKPCLLVDLPQAAGLVGVEQQPRANTPRADQRVPRSLAGGAVTAIVLKETGR